MLVTTKGRYALRMMLNIASYGTDQKIALRQVAEEERAEGKHVVSVVAPVKAAYRFAHGVDSVCERQERVYRLEEARCHLDGV